MAARLNKNKFHKNATTLKKLLLYKIIAIPTNSITSAANVPKATDSKPDNPTPKQKPVITLTSPTLTQTTKAYTGSLTAFTYDEILAFVEPTNTAALSIDSVISVADTPDILTSNSEEKTLTFTDINALPEAGQQSTYTITFSSPTHKVVPSSMDIPFIVKKGEINLNVELTKTVCVYGNFQPAGMRGKF